MVNQPVHLARRYVNMFLLDLLQSDNKTKIVRRSTGLPEFSGQPSPDFARFRNRLKVMAGLDSVTYPTPKNGTLEIAFDREVNGHRYHCHYTLRLQFTDSSRDPSVELHTELKSQEPCVDHHL